MNNDIKIMPAVALRGTTILPGTIVHFDVSRERSVRAIEQAMLQDQMVFLVAQKDALVEEPVLADLYKVGTIAKIKQVVKVPKNIRRVLVEGLERAELIGFDSTEEYLEAEIMTMTDEEETELPPAAREAMVRSIHDMFLAYCKENPNFSKEIAGQILDIQEIEKLLEQLNINLSFSMEDKQKFLELRSLSERYEWMGTLLSNEINIAQIRKELQRKIKERIDKNQKEYILREQLKLIREELGEDHTQTDIDNFKKSVGKLKASKEVKEKIMEEITRFQNIGINSSESAVMRGYIETLLALPWDKVSRDNQDLKKAWDILEADHYGLEKVKERIMEFLAVRVLNKKGHSPILCLVGPPGTGKTSIGRSIATALDKKYVRLSLGGVRD